MTYQVWLCNFPMAVCPHGSQFVHESHLRSTMEMAVVLVVAVCGGIVAICCVPPVK